jgi:hypothetical protein
VAGSDRGIEPSGREVCVEVVWRVPDQTAADATDAVIAGAAVL